MKVQAPSHPRPFGHIITSSRRLTSAIISSSNTDTPRRHHLRDPLALVLSSLFGRVLHLGVRMTLQSSLTHFLDSTSRFQDSPYKHGETKARLLFSRPPVGSTVYMSHTILPNHPLAHFLSPRDLGPLFQPFFSSLSAPRTACHSRH